MRKAIHRAWLPKVAGKRVWTVKNPAAAGFFTVHTLLPATLGNHALWIAFLTYLALRGIVQGLQLPGIVRRSFASTAQTSRR